MGIPIKVISLLITSAYFDSLSIVYLERISCIMPIIMFAEIIIMKKTCENPAPTTTSAVNTAKHRMFRNVKMFVTNMDR